MAQRTSVWRNCFKTLRQFGETLIMVLIADIMVLIADISVILRQILVRLYFITVTRLGLNNYESQTQRFRQPPYSSRQWKTSLLRQFPALSVYDALCAQANRSTRPPLIR